MLYVKCIFAYLFLFDSIVMASDDNIALARPESPVALDSLAHLFDDHASSPKTTNTLKTSSSFDRAGSQDSSSDSTAFERQNAMSFREDSDVIDLDHQPVIDWMTSHHMNVKNLFNECSGGKREDLINAMKLYIDQLKSTNALIDESGKPIELDVPYGQAITPVMAALHIAYQQHIVAQTVSQLQKEYMLTLLKEEILESFQQYYELIYTIKEKPMDEYLALLNFIRREQSEVKSSLESALRRMNVNVAEFAEKKDKCFSKREDARALSMLKQISPILFLFVNNEEEVMPHLKETLSFLFLSAE